MLSCQQGRESFRSASRTCLYPYHKQCRLFWGEKGIRKNIRKLYLIKWKMDTAIDYSYYYYVHWVESWIDNTWSLITDWSFPPRHSFSCPIWTPCMVTVWSCFVMLTPLHWPAWLELIGPSTHPTQLSSCPPTWPMACWLTTLRRNVAVVEAKRTTSPTWSGWPVCGTGTLPICSIQSHHCNRSHLTTQIGRMIPTSYLSA